MTLKLNRSQYRKSKKVFYENNGIFSLVLGATEIPDHDNDEHDEEDLDVRGVLKLFELDAENKKNGRTACLNRHNAKRALHEDTPPMEV